MSEGSWHLKQRHQCVRKSPEPPTFALQKVRLQAFPSERCSRAPIREGLEFTHTHTQQVSLTGPNARKHNDEPVTASRSENSSRFRKSGLWVVLFRCNSVPGGDGAAAEVGLRRRRPAPACARSPPRTWKSRVKTRDQRVLLET